MKEITKFVADDGSEHTTPESALNWDALIAKVSEAMEPLYLADPKVRAAVASGKGWAQHSPDTVVSCRDAILDICCEQGIAKHYPVFLHRGKDAHPRCAIGRILNDYGGPLSRAWSRFCRIDEEGREHQQCYFAYAGGPDKDHVCLADLRTK